MTSEKSAFKPYKTIEAINWNAVNDFDNEVWRKLTSQFWLPEKIPVANDMPIWNQMSDAEKDVVNHVFVALTLLDTIQSQVGAIAMMPDSLTPHEEAVFANINFMECYTKEHELLTPDGWKHIEEITTKDLVAQYCAGTETIDFVHPIATSRHVADETFEIRANEGRWNIIQHVSPGHRVYIQNASGDSFVVATAKDMYEKGIPSFNGLPNFLMGAKYCGTRENKESFPLDEFIVAVRLLGGEIQKAPDGKTDRVVFDNKVSGLDSLNKLASSLGMKLERNKDGVTWVDLNFHAHKLTHLNEIFKLDSDEEGRLENFINAFKTYSDIAFDTDGGNGFGCETKDEAEFVAAAATLSGMKAKVKCATGGGYCVAIENSKVIGATRVTIERLPGEEVYGVEVPSTFLLTRNNGSVVVSGNCVHAKSYSTIFSTLISTPEIDSLFAWAKSEPHLQYKARRIQEIYADGMFRQDGMSDLDWNMARIKKKAASVLLESFLFYSGFYAPFRFAAHGKLINVSDVIKLITRDESVHGYYIGAKLQDDWKAWGIPDELWQEFLDWVKELTLDLLRNEDEWTEMVYDSIGWTADAKKFVRYNANKAFMNMGIEPMFGADEVDASPEVLASLDLSAEQHDFFSSQGSSYIIGNIDTAEEAEDWDDIFDDE